MHARLLLCCALLGAPACTTAEDGTPLPTDDEMPQEATGALSSSEGHDDGTMCRRRHYWTCKDSRTRSIHVARWS